jgi:succinate dehydrogenase / fumarate reductase cytochrome b subunit
MTLATATTTSDHTLPLLGGRNHFLLRRLHSLTGIVFGGYLVVHLLINATIAQFGGEHDVFQMQVDKIHSLPILWVVEWVFIYLPIIFHTIYGIWITFTAQPNPHQYPYAKNIFYTLQRTSAIVIVLFMIFHVFSLKMGWFGPALTFDPKFASMTVHRHMTATSASWFIVWIAYPLGILASCYHLANGFWTAAITWGLTISAGSQRRWGFACAGLFVITMIFGFTALYAAVNLKL